MQTKGIFDTCTTFQLEMIIRGMRMSRRMCNTPYEKNVCIDILDEAKRRKMNLNHAPEKVMA